MKLPVSEWLERIKPKLKSFRYPALVLLVGLLLLLLPSKAGKSAQTQETAQPAQGAETESYTDDDYRRATERELAAILSQIDGAGKVSVILTLRAGTSVQYQTDYENSNQTGDTVSSTAKQSTVILRRDGAYDEAAVVKTEYPQFQGALIVSEGANDPVVRWALEKAAAVLLRLGTDKITVVKMK